MTLATIKEAIEQLPPEEQTILASWLSERDWKAWDEQIEHDFSPGGHVMPLLAELEREIAEGKTRPMEEGFAERRKSRQRAFNLERSQGSGSGVMNCQRRYSAKLTSNPLHPSLRLKAAGPFWSKRVSGSYRALTIRKGDVFHWFWIGPHGEYGEILKRG